MNDPDTRQEEPCLDCGLTSREREAYQDERFQLREEITHLRAALAETQVAEQNLNLAALVEEERRKQAEAERDHAVQERADMLQVMLQDALRLKQLGAALQQMRENLELIAVGTCDVCRTSLTDRRLWCDCCLAVEALTTLEAVQAKQIAELDR